MNTRTLALVGVIGLGAGACVDNGADAPMRIIGNVAPGENCAVDSTSSTFRDDGVIDGKSLFGYVFTPSVVNDIVVIGDEALGPKTIYITHARVDIAFYDDAFADVVADPTLLEFQVPTSGAIDPGGGTSAFSFEIVPVELVRAIGARLGPALANQPPPRTALDVRVQMVGTKGGGEVESQTYRYSVEVCTDCLKVNQGTCMSLPAGYEPEQLGGVCNIFQDGPIDCCDNGTVCPAQPPPPPV